MVLGGVGRAGGGVAAVQPASSFFPQPCFSHAPAHCSTEAWGPGGPGTAQILSFLVWEVRGGGGRIKFTDCHRWPPQLFTSTRRTHICLQFWNQSCLGPPPNTHSRPSFPKPMLPVFRARGCWVQARQGLHRPTDQSPPSSLPHALVNLRLRPQFSFPQSGYIYLQDCDEDKNDPIMKVAFLYLPPPNFFFCGKNTHT